MINIPQLSSVYSLESENGKYRHKRQSELLGILNDNNYSLFLINESEYTFQELKEIPVHSDMLKTNYFMCHNDNKSQFENFNFQN